MMFRLDLKKKFVLIGAIVGVVVISNYSYKNLKSPTLQQQSPENDQVHSESEVYSSVDEEREIATDREHILPMDESAPAGGLGEELTPPSEGQLQQAVTEDPHRPPTALLEFGAKLGPKMENALASEEAAIPLFEELKKCVLDPSHPATVQAICLSNAKILGEVYPHLNEQLRRVQEQADAEAVRLAGGNEES